MSLAVDSGWVISPTVFGLLSFLGGHTKRDVNSGTRLETFAAHNNLCGLIFLQAAIGQGNRKRLTL